jgi:glycosyltransferase involved in cell wall biosynthesis
MSVGPDASTLAEPRSTQSPMSSPAATSNSPEGPSVLKVLLGTAVPPPEHGGINNWTRVMMRGMEHECQLQMSFVDTTPHYRGIPHCRLLSRLLFGSVQALRDTWRIYRQLKRARPDVLHLNTSAGLATPKDILILMIAKHLGVPSVAHYHMQNAPADMAHRRFEWGLTRWGMSLATAVVTLDARSHNLVETTLPGKRVVTLPTMVELDVIDALCARHAAQPPARSGPARIIFLGFCSPHKGAGDLVEACARLSEHAFVLDLAGPVLPVGYERHLQAVAARKEGGQWLRFHGPLPHAEALTRILEADMLVLPSHGESAPAVLLEAMACQKPVVSTFVGAVPEMLDIGGPQECGVCVPPHDIDALAAAIAGLLDDPRKRQELARKGRKRVETLYSVPVGCRQLRQLWQSLKR